MKIKILAFLFLLAGCKSTKQITHPSLRTDGFYYRHKVADIYHLVRFFDNGRVVVSRRLSKPELFEEYADILMRNVDTLMSFFDVKKSSFKIRNDSVFFIKKPDNYANEIYDVSYALNLQGDLLAGTIEVVNFDSTMLKIWQFEKTHIERKINTSFKFVKASYDRKKKYPPLPDHKYVGGKYTKNGKLVVEDL